MTFRSQSHWFAIGLLLSAVFLEAQSDPTLEPFTIDHRKAMLAHSPVDVSFLLDAPAGKHGFVRAQGAHLVTGDGKRIRFWGVNVTDWSKGSVMVPSKEDAPLWAATLARFGVNCVRFQFLDLPTPRGTVALSVPPGTSSGAKLRVKGHGVVPKNGPPGDLLAEIQIVLPKQLSDADRQTLRQIDQHYSQNPRGELRW